MEIKGDFLGFTFAGIHSSNFNIIRTSDGDRFDEELTPEIKNISVEVPGMDGEYYFGSTYGPRTIEVSFAYDNLNEEQLRRMRKIYGRRQQAELIFDERPYKRYIAKIESPIELSYVCFDEKDFNWRKIQDSYNQYVKGIQGRDYEYKEYDETTRRIYKGEGKISFICYFPFAKSAFKVLPEIGSDYYEGRDNWAAASGILSKDEIEAKNIDRFVDGEIKVYNAGDIETGFRLYCPFSQISSDLSLTYKLGTTVQAQLNIDQPTRIGSDEGILIDTTTGLIVGVKDFTYTQDGNVSYSTTGNLYNRYYNSGYFFKLEPNLKGENATIEITGGNESMQIFYDYLYF